MPKIHNWTVEYGVCSECYDEKWEKGLEIIKKEFPSLVIGYRANGSVKLSPMIKWPDHIKTRFKDLTSMESKVLCLCVYCDPSPLRFCKEHVLEMLSAIQASEIALDEK